jgi:outer membrane immunogenic protein
MNNMLQRFLSWLRLRGDTCARLRKTEVGLALGAGAEYAMGNNWSLNAEYLFIKPPTKEVSDPRDELALFQFTTDAHFARVGLNYRFGY